VRSRARKGYEVLIGSFFLVTAKQAACGFTSQIGVWFKSKSNRSFIVRLLGVPTPSRRLDVRPLHKSSRRRTNVDL
jgi:hypothetical protein